MLERGVLLPMDEATQREFMERLQREHRLQTYGDTTRELVQTLQVTRDIDIAGRGTSGPRTT